MIALYILAVGTVFVATLHLVLQYRVEMAKTHANADVEMAKVRAQAEADAARREEPDDDEEEEPEHAELVQTAEEAKVARDTLRFLAEPGYMGSDDVDPVDTLVALAGLACSDDIGVVAVTMVSPQDDNEGDYGIQFDVYLNESARRRLSMRALPPPPPPKEDA